MNERPCVGVLPAKMMDYPAKRKHPHPSTVVGFEQEADILVPIQSPWRFVFVQIWQWHLENGRIVIQCEVFMTPTTSVEIIQGS